jgi:cytidylate kinase
MTAEHAPRRIEEQLALRERVLGGEVGVITVGGDAGTGTTSAATALREKLGISPIKAFLVGEVARKYKDHAGDQDLDRMLDAAQELLILKADPREPALTESRLGPFFLYRNHVPGISIELTAPKAVRMKRLTTRAIENEIARLNEGIENWQMAIEQHYDPPMTEDVIRENEELIESLTAGTAEGFTLEDITAREDARKRDDINRFRKIYPWFKDMHLRDPYYPCAVGPDGRRIYDITIPTAVLSKEQVIETLFGKIIEFRQTAEFQSRIQPISEISRGRTIFKRPQALIQLPG